MTVVARVVCPDYDRVDDALRRALEFLGDQGPFAAPGEPVLLKPNLLAPYPAAAAVTTHPAVLDALLSAACDLGARPVVADSPGFGSAERVARVSGILAVCRRHGAPLLDLGVGEVRRASGRTYRDLELAREALEARWLWNLPKWKTHTMMGLTLGVKNLYGCVPGKRKVAGHFRAGRSVDSFARSLLDLWDLLKPALTVLDGVVAMEGAGPSRGRPIVRGLLLASSDAPALDWEAARLSGFDPRDVPTVRLCLAQGRVRPERVEVCGDPAEPLRFEPAAGSPCDFSLPGPLKRLLAGVLSPAPRFDARLCTGCAACCEACPAGALTPGAPPEFSQERCVRCYCCQELCPSGAVRVPPRGIRRRLPLVGGRRS
ncbi:MAG: DUF362 domain-containing protein [Deltaproteobacteria bacterium]|nr:DUF362 domain-containing protein [Deltaproteobacteria bacterium]